MAKMARSYICTYHYLAQEDDQQVGDADLQQLPNENLLAQQQELLFLNQEELRASSTGYLDGSISMQTRGFHGKCIHNQTFLDQLFSISGSSLDFSLGTIKIQRYS